MKVIHYINLFVTVAHTLLLIVSSLSALFKNDDLFFYAAYSHFGFGVFQVILSLVCLFFAQKVTRKSRNKLFSYFVIIVIYFLIMYAFSNFRFSNEKIIMVSYMVIIPMIIAYFFLFTTWNFMKDIQDK